ncbi:hypothetical protein HELRODRAFT_71418, partial [Helobdella robusta]|uniref:Protein kinase domain-containing protein n=1 Tax=Helobdella robusta TaxID=6412 RepID=T1G0L3_HELRO
VEDFFHVVDEIGRGSCGIVRRVIDKNSGNQYACKFIQYSDLATRDELVQELEILALLDHANVVQVVDGYENKKRLAIVMEIVTGGELLQRLVTEDSLTESEVAYYIRQLLIALEYMHSNNVIHLDLKPENLHLSNQTTDELKLIDFGYSRLFHPLRKLHVKYATPEFCSPEVVIDDTITPATDVWNVGILTYLLLSGISPFYRETHKKTLADIRDGMWEFDAQAFADISAESRDFISKLLQTDPK